jgi:hypothetical protein
MREKLRFIGLGLIAALAASGCAQMSHLLASSDTKPQLEARGPGMVFPSIEGAAVDEHPSVRGTGEPVADQLDFTVSAGSATVEFYTVAALEGATETTPTVGNKLTSSGEADIVVYTHLDENGYGDIYYRELANGVPVGAAVRVSSDPPEALTDDRLNDVSGDRIVYTAFESPASQSGAILLSIRSAPAQPPTFIVSAEIMHEVRIHGNYVAWVEGADGSTVVNLIDLRESDPMPMVIAGPLPPATQVDIGDRFVVWVEHVRLGEGTRSDIAAYDLADGADFLVTVSAETNESAPTTSGPWIAWQAQDAATSEPRSEAFNIDTYDLRVIADNSAANRRPSMDEGLVGRLPRNRGQRSGQLLAEHGQGP